MGHEPRQVEVGVGVGEELGRDRGRVDGDVVDQDGRVGARLDPRGALPSSAFFIQSHVVVTTSRYKDV